MSAANPAAGSPTHAATPVKGPGKGLKASLIALAVAGYTAVGAYGTVVGGQALYMALNSQRPSHLGLEGLQSLWQESEESPRHRKMLKASVGGMGGLFFFALPLIAVGATQRKRELHGSARWANHTEIHKAGLMSGQGGIVVGKMGPKYLTLTGQQSVVLSAPTRSGKGVGIVVPNCLSFQGSIVVMDIKGENHRITAGFRAKHGQQVFKWAPFAEDGRTHRWNPLATVRAEPRYRVGDLLEIGQVLYPSQGGTDNDKFFNNKARDLFLGLGLYLLETPELPRTIGELLRQSSGKGQSLSEYLRKLISERAEAGRPLSDVCIDTLNRFMSTSENTLASIKATFDAPLTIFSDPFVDAATSHDDIGLQDLRRKPMSVFVDIPPRKLADAAVVLNLFFSQAINLNTGKLPEEDPSLKTQLLLVLDEFTAMGRVGALAKGISYIAGYNVRVLTVIQAMSQLDSTYGKDDARTFATNHALQIMYAPREQRDANEYSEALGTFTQKEESRGRSVNHGAKGGASTSRNESSQRRALLLPQEFKELGTDRQVVMLENCKPILAEKIRYYDDPTFTARLLPPPATPAIDLDLHQARVERRIRTAAPGEQFTLEQLAGDFGRMPRLPDQPTTEDVQDFVGAFLRAGDSEPLPASQPFADSHVDEDGVITPLHEVETAQ